MYLLIPQISECKKIREGKFVSKLMPYHHFLGKGHPRGVSTEPQNKEKRKSSVPSLFCSLTLFLQVAFT